MTRKRTGKRKARNPTGLKPGELMSEYTRTTVRLPRDVRAVLKRTAKHEQRPEWRVLVDAIREYGEKALRRIVS
jgi:hypothetical protein